MHRHKCLDHTADEADTFISTMKMRIAREHLFQSIEQTLLFRLFMNFCAKHTRPVIKKRKPVGAGGTPDWLKLRTMEKHSSM